MQVISSCMRLRDPAPGLSVQYMGITHWHRNNYLRRHSDLAPSLNSCHAMSQVCKLLQIVISACCSSIYAFCPHDTDLLETCLPLRTHCNFLRLRAKDISESRLPGSAIVSPTSITNHPRANFIPVLPIPYYCS